MPEHQASSGSACAVRAAILGLGDEHAETLELVLTTEQDRFALTIGALTSLPEATMCGAVSLPLAEELTMHLEFIGGADKTAAAALEWGFAEGWGLLVSHLMDLKGKNAVYVDLAHDWTF